VADFVIVFSIVTGLVTLACGYVALADYINDRHARSAEKFPIKIWRSIRYRAYLAALTAVAQRIRTSGFSPDYIVAIQYGAFVPAAELAKQFRKPVLHVEATLDNKGPIPVCRSVTPKFDEKKLEGMQVVIVDNTITTGLTLEMTLARLRGIIGVQLVSCVVYRPSLNSANYANPDHLLFKSRKRISPILR